MAVEPIIPHRTFVVEKVLSSKDGYIETYFCKVKLGIAPIRVILCLSEGDPLGHLLLKRCREADYNCCLLHSGSRVMETLEGFREQALIFIDTDMANSTHPETSTLQNDLEHLSQCVIGQGLEYSVGLVGIVKDLSSTKLMDKLLQSGISRVLTREECLGDRFIWELKMLEKSEVAMKEKQIFGLALYEAVEQTTDAIQITDKESNIMYVNRAFLEMSGYSFEEVIGQPAWDILRPFDSAKPDNGPKVAVKKGKVWDGICMGRRKSGSVLRQHLKFIPVHGSADKVYHHVTIQRLLSIHDSTATDHSRVTSPARNDFTPPYIQKRMASRTKLTSYLESPLIKTVQMLNLARDNASTPQDIKETLDKAIESLSNSELYTIPSNQSGNIVSGLLQETGRTASGSFMRTHAHPLNSTAITAPPPAVKEALTNIEDWTFDILNMEAVSESRALYYVGMKLFNKWNLCNDLDIEVGILSSWLKLMENNYRHNPYHNSTHAADVLQATAYFIDILQDQLIQQGESLERMEIAALLISAAIHDLDHPGRTNPYLCNTRDPLAILYNDKAVLENHHVAYCFKLTEHSKDVNIFQNLDEATFRSLRTSIIDLVLATDMAKHFEHLTKFNISLVDGDTGSATSLVNKDTSRENRMVMKRIIVKCADISNPCRPLKLCKVWAARIAEEYFAQTDNEKQRKLPVVFPDFDRHTCRLPVTQVRFIDFFITGLFEAWNTFCPIPAVMDYLKSNYEQWKSQCPDSPNYSEEEPDTNPNST